MWKNIKLAEIREENLSNGKTEKSGNIYFQVLRKEFKT